MIVKTEAIVLKSIKFGDTSIISHIYTKSDGKISTIAKGARSTKSKFIGVLEPMNYLSINYYKKSEKDLHILSAAEKIIDFHKIPSSLEHLTCGLMFIESLNQTQESYESNTSIFELSVNFLSLLNKLEKNPFPLFINSQIQLLKLIGYELDFSPVESITDSILYISYENGSAYRKKITKNMIKFDKKTYNKISEISQLELENCNSLKITEIEFRQIVNFFVNYFGFHLDRKFFYSSLFLLK